MISRRRGLLVVVLGLVVGALAVPGAAGRQQDEATASLAAATRSFLDLWFGGDVRAAADRYLSAATIARPELLAPLDEMGGERRQRPDAQADARTRLREGLLAARRQVSTPDTKRPPLSEISGPQADEVIEVLGDRRVATRRLSDPPAIAFPVTGWRDLSWTGTAGPSVRSALTSDVLPRGEVQAVVVLLRLPESGKSLPVVLVWSRGAPGSEWKLVTILPVLTE